MSKLKYDDVYPKRWVQPATYIRFSSTVEDCKGTQYCMTSEDEVALKALNAKKPPGMQCTEDWFEEVFDFFERTAQEKQPFAAVDNPPALPYEEFENSFDETISDPAQKFAKDIYDYWKQQRLKRGNHSLMPMLKFETNLETDDSDPYVCFRRREVRQARKTRGRDAQVTEKLKKLRHELEQARELMYFVKQREYGRRDQLVNDRLIFEKRMEVKEIKRNLGIKGDDEDLINQRVRLTLPLTFIIGRDANNVGSLLQSRSRSSIQMPYSVAFLVWSPSLSSPVSMVVRWTTTSSHWRSSSRRGRMKSLARSRRTRRSTASGTNTTWT